MSGLVITAGIVLRGSAPLPPGVVNATPLSETSVLVEWADDSQPPANARRFLVERSTDEVNWAEVDTVPGLTLTDTGLTAGTAYYYRVSGINAWGQTLGPEIAEVTTPSPGPPDAPSDLVATVVSSESINLSWTDNSDNDDGFELQRDSSNTFPDPTSILVDQHSSLYTDAELTPETTYYYRVRATNSIGDSDWSNTANATTATAGDFAFSTQLIGDAAIGIGPDLEQIYQEESVAQNSTDFWTWFLGANDLFDSDYPGLGFGTHHNPIRAVCFYRNLLDTPGGNPSFVRENPGLLGEVAVPSAFGNLAGSLNIADFDGDGRLDVLAVTQSVNRKLWQRQEDGTLLPSDTASTSTSQRTYLRPLKPGVGGLDYDGTIWTKNSSSTIHASQEIRHWTWNDATSNWDRTTSLGAPPEGIDPAVVDEINAYIQSLTVEWSVTYIPLDMDGDGVQDLIVNVNNGYAGPTLNRCWFLQWTGSQYVDRTEEWGLPKIGKGFSVTQLAVNQHLTTNEHYVNEFAQRSITAGRGQGVPVVFVGRGEAATVGYYKWNGSGYTKQDSPVTQRLRNVDVYGALLFVCNLTNSMHLDLILKMPRSAMVFIFINDGLGNFTQYTSGAHGTGDRAGHYVGWDPWGMAVADFNNNGLLDIALGGEDGPTGGANNTNRIKRVVSMLRNTTTNSGNYLKVKVRLASGDNKYGVGGMVSVHDAGESFSPASKIGDWHAWPNGLPCHFGLGSISSVDVRFTPETGTPVDMLGVNANQTVTIVGGD